MAQPRFEMWLNAPLSCVTADKSLTLSEPVFPTINEDNATPPLRAAKIRESPGIP